MLIKLEVNLPFKDAHPTPTEISGRTVQQGWRQRWLSPFVSPAAYEAPPSRPFGFQPGRWFGGQRPAVALGARAEEQPVSSDASGAAPLQSAAFREVLGQKLHFMFSSAQWTSFHKNLFGSSSNECLGHSSMVEMGQEVDWSSAQSPSLLWGNAATTFNRELSILWKLGQEGEDPSFTSMMSSYSHY